MDTTFVFNQVKVPTGINTVVENMPSLPDSIHVSIDNLVNVAQESVEPVTIWGLTLDWGAIIIPTVASLIVFILGLIAENIKNSRKNKRETQEYRAALFAWIDLMGSSVFQQITSVRKLSVDIASNTTLQSARFQFSKTLIDKLDISGKTVIKYLINNSSDSKDGHREENAFNIISQCDYLQSAEKEILRQYEAYQAISIKLLEDWNNNITELNELLNSLPRTNEEAPAVLTCREIYKNFRNSYSENNGLVDILSIKEYLLDPILNSFPDYKYGSIMNPSIDRILLLVRNLLILIKNWEKNKEGFADIFNNYADRCENSFALLIDSKNYFKNKTVAIR